MCSSLLGTCQYSDFRSRAEKILAPFNASRVSSIWGRGWAPLTVTSFNSLKSTQNLKVPFFFFYHHHGGHPQTARQPSNFLVKHFFQLFLFLPSHFRILPPIWLVNRRSLCVNFMFNQMVFPNLKSFPAKTSLNSSSNSLSSFLCFTLSSSGIWG